MRASQRVTPPFDDPNVVGSAGLGPALLSNAGDVCGEEVDAVAVEVAVARS